MGHGLAMGSRLPRWKVWQGQKLEVGVSSMMWADSCLPRWRWPLRAVPRVSSLYAMGLKFLRQNTYPCPKGKEGIGPPMWVNSRMRPPGAILRVYSP